MWVVLRNALGARRGQAVIVALVAMLACAAAAVAPLYAVRAVQQVGVAAVAGAPVEERLVSVTWSAWGDTGQRPTAAAAMDEARRQFKPSAFTPIDGGLASARLRRAAPGNAVAEVDVAQREGVCTHLVLTGSCPAAAGEVVVPASLAQQLSLAVGDRMELVEGTKKPVPARLVGVYQVIDPSDAYWGDGDLVGTGPDDGSSDRTTAFTVRATLRSWERATFTYDLVAKPGAFDTTDVGQLAAKLDSDLGRLRTQGYTATTNGLEDMLDRITRDRRNVTLGVGVGVIVLLLLTWFALAVVVKEAAVQAREDVGWWRLHGAPSGRGWVLVLGQSLVPLAAGAVAGAAVGLGLWQLLGGAIEGGSDRLALSLSLALVGLVFAGGCVAVVVAQVGTLLTPVRDLLRRIPVRRTRWRRPLVDVVLVGLSVYGIVQALVVGGRVEGLPLLAPGLAALALALVAAWAVPPAATWLATHARYSGRPALVLIAALMARRPETYRLFALVVVAIALVTTAFVGLDTASRTQQERAALEVGADRVITVDAKDAAQLQAVVRRVDPDGTKAMAVVDQPGLGGEASMLAVDSDRLAVVAGWREAYGGTADEVADALKPTEPKPVTLRTGRLALAASATDPRGGAVYLRIRLRATNNGKPIDAVVGPLTTTRDSYTADVPACATGCRLVGVQVLGRKLTRPVATTEVRAGAVGHGLAGEGTHLELYPTPGHGRSGLSAALLSDPARWRPPVGPRDLGPALTTVKAGLRLIVPTTSPDVPLERSDWAFVADTPMPMPALVSGWRPEPIDEVRMVPLPGAAVPSEVSRTATLVPRHGKVGAMVDLTYAERSVPFALPGSGIPEVWLSPTAPASIVDDLRKAGLTPLRQESLSDRLAQLRAEGTAVGERFHVAVALVGLLLAAGAVLVDATRERPSRAAELSALRTQGVDAKVVRTVGYGGLAAVAGTATIVGLAAGLAGAGIDRVLYPGFVDGWNVLPTESLRAFPVLAAAVITTAVLGAVVLTAGAALVRRTQVKP